MECLPFVRRLTLIREASRPESPSQFNSKAFPPGRRRRCDSASSSRNSRSLSTASTLSTKSSFDSSDPIPSTASDHCPRLESRHKCKTRSPDVNSSEEIQGSATLEFYANHRRWAASPTHLFPHQREDTLDQSTTAFTMDIDEELEVHILLTGDEDFLGMTIVGHRDEDGESSIFVGTVIPGGAVSRDGRIMAGDMIVSVNDVSLRGKSNNQVVDILRHAAKSSSGSIKLTVLVCDNVSVYSDKSCVRPIDPYLWLTHSSFIEQNNSTAAKTIPDHPADYSRAEGIKSLSSLASSSLSSSMPSTAATKHSMQNHGRMLPFETPVDIVANRLKSCVLARANPYGNKFKSIAAASITGRQLREWLYRNIKGFKDLQEVNLYAAQLFLMGYITPIKQLLDWERVHNSEFSLEESYVVQTRPLSPAVRSTTPSPYTRSSPTTACTESANL